MSWSVLNTHYDSLILCDMTKVFMSVWMTGALRRLRYEKMAPDIWYSIIRSIKVSPVWKLSLKVHINLSLKIQGNEHFIKILTQQLEILKSIEDIKTPWYDTKNIVNGEYCIVYTPGNQNIDTAAKTLLASRYLKGGNIRHRQVIFYLNSE